MGKVRKFKGLDEDDLIEELEYGEDDLRQTMREAERNRERDRKSKRREKRSVLEDNERD